MRNEVMNVVIIMSVVFSLGYTLFLINDFTPHSLSGKATAEGNIDLCINTAPVLNVSSCSTTATVSVAYSCTVNITDSNPGQNVSLTDNSDLFDVTPSGLISFTPVAADVGTHTINISGEDDSRCPNNSTTASYSLTVNAAAGTPSSPSAGGGGGGGGAVSAPPQDVFVKRWKEFGEEEEVVLPSHLALKSIQLSSEEKVTNTVLSVYYNLNAAELRIPPLAREAYKYYRVTTQNLKHVDEYTVTFQVPDEWMEQYALEPHNIHFYRYNHQAEEWVPKRTQYLGNREYQAETLFSHVAIGTCGISTDKSSVTVQLKQGRKYKESILITNEGSGAVKVTPQVEKISSLVGVEDTAYLPVLKNSSLTLEIDSNEILPKVHVGTLQLRLAEEEGLCGFSKPYVLEVPLIIQVESENAYFDAIMDIGPRYKQLKTGEELSFQTTILNLLEQPVEELDVTFSILNMKGEEMLTKKEKISVDRQATIVRTILLPEEAEPGQYILTFSAQHQGAVSSATELFRIVEKPTLQFPQQVALSGLNIVLVIVVLFALVVAYTYRKLQGLEKETTKKLTRKAQLDRKRQVLKESLEKGYISSAAFEKTMNKLKKELKKYKN